MSGDTVIPRGESDAAYPEVFSTMPPQPTVKKPGQLPTEKIREYFEKVRIFFDLLIRHKRAVVCMFIFGVK